MSTEKKVEPRLKFDVRWLPVKTMVRHPKLQRTFRQSRANALAEQFDPDKFGELWVVPGNGRDSERWYVFSGQHRLSAVRKLLGEDQSVPCRVYEPLTDAQIADLFLAVDDQMALVPLDRFLMRVTKGDGAAKAILAIVRHYGLDVRKERVPGVVQAVGALEFVFTRDGGASAVNRTLGYLNRTWGTNPDAYHKDLIRGLGMIALRHGATLDEKALVKALGGEPRGPMGLVGTARDRAQIEGGSVAHSVAELVLRRYNKGRRKKLELEQK